MHTIAGLPISRLRSTLAPKGRAPRPLQEDEALGRLLGIDTCERCGHTILLGEGRHRVTLQGLSRLVCRDCEAQVRLRKASRAA